MKRSRMLYLMEQEFNNWLSHPVESYEIEMMLSFLEREGMLPPSIPTGASGWEVGKGKPSYINEWESENEKK